MAKKKPTRISIRKDLPTKESVYDEYLDWKETREKRPRKGKERDLSDDSDLDASKAPEPKTKKGWF